jgi:hypothetical protein
MADRPIIDMEGLYRAGYNSRIDAENADKDRRVQLIDQLFIKAGSWVVDRYKQNHTALKGLKQLGRASNSQIQMEVEKLGAQLTPTMQASLNLYKQEYDKGARMSVRGMSKKKKEEGQIMMDMAFHKMQTMKKGLNVVQEKMKEQVDNGMIELGEKGFNNTAVTGWNSGATEAEFNNAVRLATGEMLGNLSIDDETGEIYYMEQAMANTSEEAYGEYEKEQLDAGLQDYMGYDDWAAQQVDPEPEATLFTRIQFPGEEDNTLQDQYKTIRDKHEKSGLDGFLVDDDSTTKLQIELENSYKNATDTQIRSFLFGGQISAVVDGELVRVTPAQKLLIDSGIPPGKADGTEVEQAQFFSFQQALEELKGEDFSKGSPRREELIGMVTESVEGYQNNAHEKYLAKEEKARKANQEEESPTGYVKKKKLGQYVLEDEWYSDWQPTINNLNSQEESIPTWNGPGGYAIKKVKNNYMVRNSSDAIKNGGPNWVNVSREFLAEKFQLLGDIENLTYEDDDQLLVNETDWENKEEELANAPRHNFPKKYQVTLNGEVVDVRKLSSLDGLNEEDKMKWLNAASE